MKKQILFFCSILILILNTTFVQQASAYSYGDPGEEQMAEAYKEMDKHLQADDWDRARSVYDTYEKDFDLYFKATQPLIETAFEEKDKELLLESYQYAMLLNVERRLHFAEDQFEDYGQAKLLLAKARGTFNVMEPLLVERADQETSDNVYKAFDDALKALGNPGLFGIGSKGTDEDVFKEKTSFIITTLKEHFKLPSDEKEDESHLTEENLGFLNGMDEEGNSTFWLLFSIGLFIALIIIIVLNKLKNKKK
ncbi:hypothetical protein [Metabacillus iocasae]|uniref:Uncharacterized protein n=1 Tax=Priestia iocasae TaxID=2291674 RepID=A0ABS2QPZ0_9BACI|nr:hypothetical protein [Metabacillus iocasae]MBM7701283.1 hypothetical protein [Metabacillus iocasae]